MASSLAAIEGEEKGRPELNPTMLRTNDLLGGKSVLRRRREPHERATTERRGISVGSGHWPPCLKPLDYWSDGRHRKELVPLSAILVLRGCKIPVGLVARLLTYGLALLPRHLASHILYCMIRAGGYYTCKNLRALIDQNLLLQAGFLIAGLPL
jgi:hypothetical protein